MCGICGILSNNKRTNESIIGSMIGALSHRGPDNSNVFCSGQVSLGHTRLSIIDLSEDANQPMVDESGRYRIVFNGEIYNFQAIRNELINDGFRFRTRSDTEVLLNLYIKKGVDCLELLRGMFAFAIWDDLEKSLFIARDRLGKKPLIYAEIDSGFVFASEINAIVKHPEISKEIDLEALDLYLSLQYIPAPKTIYKNVFKLLPGHYAVFSRNELKLNSYWNLDYREKQKLSYEEAMEEASIQLNDAVKQRLISDVPLGALLSGGVDSSLVTALMVRNSSSRVKTFSIGFNNEAYNELNYAKTVSQHLETEHHELIVEPDIIESLPTIILNYGEPFADKSAIPSYFVSKMAREHVTVILNGDGGDELCGGYGRYDRGTIQTSFTGFLKSFHLNKPDLGGLELAERIRNPKGWIEKLKRKLIFDFFHPEYKEVFSNQFWNGQAKEELWQDRKKQNNSIQNWRLKYLEMAYLYSGNQIDNMLWALNNTYLPGDLLVKMDIASMAHGLEARSPLLDHKLIEYFASLPPAIKNRKRQSKALLKKFASKLVPPEVVYRKKMGFSVPISEWLRKELKGILSEVLTDPKNGFDDYFDSGYIEKIKNQHLSRQKDHGFRLWALMVFGIWYEHSIH